MSLRREHSARVLFLLDYGTQDADVLTVVAAMTGQKNVEVQGLFVEDTDLIEAAARPGFVEVTIGSDGVTRMNQERLHETVLKEAKRKQALFEQTAQLNDLRHRFQILRGRTLETLSRVAQPTDLVIVARSQRAGIRVRSGRQYEAVVEESSDILFVNEPWTSGNSVVALVTDDVHRDEVIEKAALIADDQRLALHILVPAGVDLTTLSEDLHPVSVPSLDVEALTGSCAALDARLLVLSEHGDVNWGGVLTGLLNGLSCSLLRIGGRA